MPTGRAWTIATLLTNGYARLFAMGGARTREQVAAIVEQEDGLPGQEGAELAIVLGGVARRDADDVDR